MRPTILLAATLLLPAAFPLTANAASFDCAKASTFVEHHICADPSLSALDERLSKVYRQVVDASPRPDAVRAEQRTWLREVRNGCTTPQCVSQAYSVRLDKLNAQARTEGSVKSDGKGAGSTVEIALEPVRSNTVVVKVPPALDVPAEVAHTAISATVPTPRSTIMFSYQILETSLQSRIAGNGGADITPPDGHTFVVVKYRYKNLTKQPIGSMRLPSLGLDLPDGRHDHPDVNASTAYAAASNLDTQLTNDANPVLNPGMTAVDADVFKVRKDLLTKPGWVLVIEADEDVKVPLTLRN
ncbi:DUF1311 domain-containing protein [Pigmentiphaga aceris]|uniref:DUF1311 domain-containing protein n=1 Tax=Pigmentiphaga aceris TaxID=1940612 RepID=A0A5C0B1B0_9BURK|nr:lysozyme inhibitor LprI family protein [Pigmentiphaga aceris]QEI07654.1 DUF1311 domain-containing protein [Pigmentiphaga aceris]